MHLKQKNNNSFREALFWVIMLELPLLFGNPGYILFDVFVVMSYFVGSKTNYNLKKCKFLIISIILAIVIGLTKGFSPYNVFKDVFYLITPIIAMMIGEIWARKKSPEEMLDFILRLGILFSIINIISLIAEFGSDVIIDPRFYRDTVDNYLTVNNVAVLSLMTTLFYLIYNKDLKYKRLIGIILLVAVYLSGSRSLYLVVVLYALAIMYPLYKKNFAKFIGLAGLFVIIVTIYIVSSPNNRIVDIFMNSFEEMKIQEYTSMADVNASYRGYEAYCALTQYDGFSVFNKVFGGGCGQMVDLGELSPFEFSEVPILHNGYPYFLVKLGIAGLVVFGIFFYELFIAYIKKIRNLNILNDTSRILYLMGLAGIIAMLLMQASVNAIFNYSYVAPLYIISAILYYERTNQM